MTKRSCSSRSATEGRRRPPIEAMLEELGEDLRLLIHFKDGFYREQLGVTVGNAAEADRELDAFASRFPGSPVKRLGDGWPLAVSRLVSEDRQLAG
jgi:hypothetical protein